MFKIIDVQSVFSPIFQILFLCYTHLMSSGIDNRSLHKHYENGRVSEKETRPQQHMSSTFISRTPGNRYIPFRHRYKRVPFSGRQIMGNYFSSAPRGLGY